MPHSLAILALLLVQPPATIDVAAFDRLVIETLRDTHNRGAALYNDNKDYLGCYRFYDGSIRTIQPLLKHRPAVQKFITDELVKIDALETARERAFRLHELIESVRGKLKDTAEPPKALKSAPGSNAPPPVSLTGVPAAPAAAGIGGSVMIEGVPASSVELMFISTDQSEPRVYSVTSTPFGHYSLSPAPPAGGYIVTVTGTGVPAKFGTTTESGLRIRIAGPSDRIDFNLKKSP